MFRYGIGITDKPQIVESTLRAFNNNCFVVTLEEEGSIFNLQLPNFTKGTILLPPPSAEIAAIDGDEHRFTEIYYSHLSDLSALEFMSLLLYTSYYSMPILLYVPTDLLYVAKFLVDFINFNFAIGVSNDCVEVLLDTTRYREGMSNILALFYLFNFIDINLFVNEFKQVSNGMTITLPTIYEIFIERFCAETGLVIHNNDYIIRDQVFNAKVNHFINVLNSSNNVIPFSMIGEPIC